MNVTTLHLGALTAARRLKTAAVEAATSLLSSQKRVVVALREPLRNAAWAFIKATNAPEFGEAARVVGLPSHAEMAETVVRLAELQPLVTVRDAARAIPGLSRAEAKALFVQLIAEGVVRDTTPDGAAGCVARLSPSAPKAPHPTPPPAAPVAEKPKPPPVRVKLAPKVSPHALERWALHHDDVSEKAVLSAWTHGLVLDNGVVAALTGAQRRAVDPNNEYRLAPDYRGIFVGVRLPGAMQIRTYLRMHSSQEEWLRRQFPDAFGGPKTT